MGGESGVLQRRNAKSTQSIQPQTFAASEPVSYRALLCPDISCLAFSCPVIWSVIFTSCNFMPCIGPSISCLSFSRPAYSAHHLALRCFLHRFRDVFPVLVSISVFVGR